MPIARSFFVLVFAFALGFASAARADDRTPEVTIVGGGPVGLASAIEASQNGAERVLVLEKRSRHRERENVLNLQKATLHNLAHLGVRFENTINPVEQRRLTANGAERRVPVERVTPDGTRHTANAREIMTGGGTVAQVHIHELEKALYEAAERQGDIDVKFRHEVTGVDRSEDSVTVTADTSNGERHFESDLLVVADGARSPTRKRMGVAFEPVSDQTSRLMVGVFNQERDGTFRMHDERNARNESQRVVGLRAAKKSGVIAEIPDSRSDDDPAKRKAWFRKRARKVGVGGKILTGPREFEIDLSRAETRAVGNNALIIGDAAATTHVFSSAGFNVGLGHAIQFGRFFERWRRASDTSERRAIAREFDRHVERMTERMHHRARQNFPRAEQERNGERPRKRNTRRDRMRRSRPATLRVRAQ